MDNSKSPLLSKTLWINVLMAVLAFLPGVDAVVKANPEVVALVITAVNFVLRLITKTQLTIS